MDERTEPDLVVRFFEPRPTGRGSSFAVQEITMPSTEPGEGVADDTAAAMQQHPSLVAVMDAVMADPDYDFLAEFDAGLDLVLDGIDRWRDPGAHPGDRVAPRH